MVALQLRSPSLLVYCCENAVGPGVTVLWQEQDLIVRLENVFWSSSLIVAITALLKMNRITFFFLPFLSFCLAICST